MASVDKPHILGFFLVLREERGNEPGCYQLTELSSITLRRNQHATSVFVMLVGNCDLIIPSLPFLPFLQFSWCQTSAHTHDQAEAMDQDPRAEDKVPAKVSHWWREFCY